MERILSIIKNFILNKGGEDVAIGRNTLSYRSPFFPSKLLNNYLVQVEKGNFTIIQNPKGVFLSYQFDMYRLFLLGIIFSVATGVMIETFWIAILFFLFLVVFNWALAIMRHRDMLEAIVREIKKSHLQKDLPNTVTTVQVSDTTM
ncbi:MAG: hypothetical protein JWQ96_275 [Segetibacter sp.]|nr:hypothetical protein [Segetibacter sp.]